MPPPEPMPERERLLHVQANEAVDILADALGYGPPDPDYGYPTGDHTIITIAMEAAARIRECEKNCP